MQLTILRGITDINFFAIALDSRQVAGKTGRLQHQRRTLEQRLLVLEPIHLQDARPGFPAVAHIQVELFRILAQAAIAKHQAGLRANVVRRIELDPVGDREFTRTAQLDTFATLQQHDIPSARKALEKRIIEQPPGTGKSAVRSTHDNDRPGAIDETIEIDAHQETARTLPVNPRGRERWQRNFAGAATQHQGPAVLYTFTFSRVTCETL